MKALYRKKQWMEFPHIPYGTQTFLMVVECKGGNVVRVYNEGKEIVPEWEGKIDSFWEKCYWTSGDFYTTWSRSLSPPDLTEKEDREGYAHREE